MSRRIWAVVALLAAGWFLHDAAWHLVLAAFGMMRGTREDANHTMRKE